MAITGLPPYKPPIEESFLCPQCQRRYLIFTGDGGSQFEGRLFEAARERATTLQAYFVDARQVRVMNCLDCGFSCFDLTPEAITPLVQ